MASAPFSKSNRVASLAKDATATRFRSIELAQVWRCFASSFASSRAWFVSPVSTLARDNETKALPEETETLPLPNVPSAATATARDARSKRVVAGAVSDA